MRPNRRLVLGAVAALVALAAVGVAWQRGADERAGEDALRRAEDAARTGRTITAADLLDRPFDRFVVMPGTATEGEIRSAVGSDWRRAAELAYHCCDPAPIWAFVDDGEVVAFFRPSMPMSYGDRMAAGEYRPSARVR